MANTTGQWLLSMPAAIQIKTLPITLLTWFSAINLFSGFNAKTQRRQGARTRRERNVPCGFANGSADDGVAALLAPHRSTAGICSGARAEAPRALPGPETPRCKRHRIYAHGHSGQHAANNLPVHIGQTKIA